MEEGTRNARINFKESQARNASRLAQPSGDLKMEFQQSLEQIRKQADTKQQKQQAASQADAQQTRPGGVHPGTPGGQAGPGGPDWSQQQQQPNFKMMMPHGAMQQVVQGYPGQGGDQGRHRQQQQQNQSSFSFNASAK